MSAKNTSRRAHHVALPSTVSREPAKSRLAERTLARAVGPVFENLERRQLLNGALDTAFGATGKAITSFGTQDMGEDLAVFADGSFVVVGESDGQFALARFNADGSPDTSFGSGGKVTTAIGSNAHATSVVIDGSGRIVVGGYALIGSNYDFALARYDATGVADSSFGSGGVVTTDFVGRNDRIFSLTIQPSGEIVAVGTVMTGPATVHRDFGLARYNAADGSLDTSFDGDGRVTTDLGSSDQAYAVAYDAALGRLVVAGGSGGSFALARYALNGTLDNTFDGDGKLTTIFPGSAVALSLGIDAAGRYVAAGHADGDFALARYHTSGALDSSFDSDGKLTTDFAGGFDQANGIAFDSSGRILVAGLATVGSNADFALARYNADGSADTTFGAGTGRLHTDIAGNADTAAAVAIQPTTNKILVAGTGNGGATQDDFAAVRYEAVAGDVWVNDTWVIAFDQGPAGLSTGDLVQNTGTGDVGPTVVRTYGFDAFDAISDAIAAVATGGTVNVLAGTYVGELEVDRPMSIVGQNAGISPNGGTRVAESILLPGQSDPNPSSAPNPVLIYIKANDVTIDGLTLDGDNPNLTSGVILNGADLDAEEAIASYDGVGSITVKNNIIRNTSYAGIDFYNYNNSGGATSNNVISDNLIQNLGAFNWGIGVLLYNNFYADVTSNVMQDVRVGVQTGNFYRANPGTTGSITNNQIASIRRGIFYNLHYQNASAFTISGNTLTAVTDPTAPSNAYWSGMLISSQQNAVTATISNNTINGSGVTNIRTAGYTVWNTPTTAELTLSGGTVSGADYGVWINNYEGYNSNANNTKIKLSGLSISANDIGVYVLDSPSNTNGSTVNATVTGGTSISVSGGTGVLVEGADATVSITNSTLAGNAVGVRARGGGNIAAMTGNFVTGSTTAGVQIDATAGSVAHITSNEISSAAGADAIANASGTAVHASGNWFGSSLQSDIRITGAVDVSPWLNSGDADAGAPGFQSSFADVNVGSIGVQIGSVGRIKEGIDAVDAGGNVYLHAGTYLESDISVNKSVVIDGVGSPAGVVVAPAVPDGHLVGGGVIFNPASHNAFVIRSSNVTIKDLTIDGDAGVGGAGSKNFHGGVVYDYNIGAAFNNLQAKNLTVQNLWRVGIYFDGGINALSTGHMVLNNTVSNVAGGHQPTAILMLQASGSVLNNDLSNVGTGIGTNYIDGTAYAPTITIRGNTISGAATGMNLSGLAAGSAVGGSAAGDRNTITMTGGGDDKGIIVQWSVGSVTVQNNQITGDGADSGIWLYRNSSAAVAPHILGNTISSSSSSSPGAGRGTGIFVTDDGSFFTESSGGHSYATISGNVISGFFRGIDLYRNEDNPAGGRDVVVTIDGDNKISAGNTGIRVFDANGTAAANAVATISGNNASIHGHAVGIEVDGGTATISGNHIYDNVTGIRILNGGVASIDNNDFNDAADNGTDIRIEASAPNGISGGAVSGNSFAGDDFFIDNASAQNLTALLSAGNTFDGADNFRIEDGMRHKADGLAVGLVSWVAGNIYVTDPAVGVSSTDSSIQQAIDAANPGDTVNVESGTYDEAVNVNKSVTVLGVGLPTVTRSSGSNQTLMTISADNVTIEGLRLLVNRPFANAGVAALNPATFDHLMIRGNTFDIAGSGGTFPNPFMTTSSAAIALLGNGAGYESVTISGNTISTDGTSLFQRGIWLREVKASVGGATAAEGNSIIASTQDLLVQFASGGATTIRNNTMSGAGVDITEPNANSPLSITDNQFLPVSPAFAQSVLVKHVYAASSPVTVSNNTFTGHTVGVLSAGSIGTVVSDNVFTPAAGATSFTHLRVDTRVPTGGSQPAPFNPNSISITGNTFNPSTAAGSNGVGVELLNGNPGAATPNFGTITLGGAGALANTFQAGLRSYLRLDSSTTAPYAPVDVNLDGSQNLYAVAGGTKLPSAMTLAERFELEDRIVHRPDVGTTGFVSVVPNHVYVTTNSFEAPTTTAPSIQRGIATANVNDTVNVAAGTYNEALNVNKTVKLVGQDQATTVVDYVGKSGFGNAGVLVEADAVELRNFTVTNSAAVVPSVPRYGLKVYRAGGAENVLLDGVTVTRSFRTGFDIHGVKNITINNATATNNGGAGFFLTDVKGAQLSNITTSGNPWTGVSIATWGQYEPIGTSGIVFSGTNSFGESGGSNGGLQLEMGNYANPASPHLISWSRNAADNAQVTIQSADFGYAMSGLAFGNANRYVRFYQTLAQAESAAAGNPDHITSGTRYIQDADDSNGLPGSGPTSFYVFDNAGNTMSIQAAVSAAVAGDTVNVAAGTYTETVTVNKTLRLQGAQAGIDARTRSAPESIVNGAGGGFTLQANGIVLDGFTIRDVTTSAPLGTGVHLSSGFSGYQVLNNIITSNIFGLYLNSSGATQTLVKHNLFDSNNNPGSASGDGIYADQGSKNILIEENKFTGHSSAAAVFAGAAGTQQDITFNNNQLVGDSSIVFFNTVNPRITNNTIGIATGTAIYLGGGNSGALVDNNTITTGTSGAIFAGDAGFGYGGDTNATITHNTINADVGLFTANRNVISLNSLGGTSLVQRNLINFSGTMGAGVSFVTGIRIAGAGTAAVTLHENEVLGNGVDTAVADPSSALRLTGTLPASAVIDATNNKLKGLDYGVYADALAAGTTVTLAQNDLSDNASMGVRAASSGAMIDASMNWWGSASASAVTAAANGGVNIDRNPWLGDGTDTSADRGFQPNMTPLLSSGLAISGAATVNEGSVYTLTLSDDGTSGTIVSWTIDWGDGPAQVISGNPGTVTHTYADGDSNYTVTASALTDQSQTITSATDVSIAVANVAPTLAVNGAASVNEGSVFTLNLGAVIDPGDDTVTSYRIDWGDGTIETYTAAQILALSNQLTHTYADDDPTGTPSDLYNIVVDLADEDSAPGWHLAAGATTVTVTNVAPTVTISGAPGSSPEGTTISLNSIVTDPGNDTFTYAWSVTKNGNAFASSSDADFTFTPDDDGTYVVSLTVTDDDTGVGTAGNQTIIVTNVAPTIAVSGSAVVNEGTVYTLNLGAVTDPGNDTVFRYIINWGDGTFVDINGNPANTVHTHTYDDGTLARHITISLFDEDAAPHANVGNPDPFTVTVNNVAPTGNFFNGGPVPEGSNGLVGFGAQFDPSAADTAAGFRYSYDFNNDGDFTDPGEFSDVTNASVGVPAMYLADGPGTRTIRGRIKDKDGGFTDYTTTITIFNVTPFVNGGPDINVPAHTAFTQNGTFADPGADAPWVGMVDYDWHPGDDDAVPLTLNGFNFTLSHTYTAQGTYTIRVFVTDKDGATGHDDILVNVGPTPSFQVSQFLVNASGFTLRFNRALDLAGLNLYDGLAGLTPSSELPDLTLVGNNVGTVRGSLVWDAGTNTATFVRTGGPLVNDTYTLTVRSGSNAFRDMLGNLLDGDANGTAGDDYVTTFNLVNPFQRTLSIPDFARGPDAANAINVPNTSALGLPVRIDDGSQVRSVDFTLRYNPSLLNITAAELAAGLPADWSITANLTTPGTAIITVFGTSSDLPAGPVNLVKLIASVPNDAPYTAAGLLRLSNITVSRNDASTISTRGDSAVHKVVYFGDADADRAYTGFDAGLISRVVVGLDSGFHNLPLTDPVISTDIDGSGLLSGIDASFVAQKAALLPRPEIPDLPGVLPPLVPGGIDPLFSAPDNKPARPGGTVSVPITIDDASNTLGYNLMLQWDTTLLDLGNADVTLGALYAGAGGWSIVTNVDDATGTATIVFWRSNGVPMPPGSGGGEVAVANFQVSPAATHNSLTPIELDGNPGASGLVFTFDDGSILVDAVAPTVLAENYTYQTAPHTLQFQFSEDVLASLSGGDFVVVNNTTSTTLPSGDFALAYDAATHTATLTYTANGGVLPDGNYTVTITAADVTDAAGNPLPGDHVFNFFFLLGDANHDGRVNLNDFNILAANFGQSGRDFTQGDFNYDGVVNLNDFNILASRFGMQLGPDGTLTPPSGDVPQLPRESGSGSQTSTASAPPTSGEPDESTAPASPGSSLGSIGGALAIPMDSTPTSPATATEPLEQTTRSTSPGGTSTQTRSTRTSSAATGATAATAFSPFSSVSVGSDPVDDELSAMVLVSGSPFASALIGRSGAGSVASRLS